MYRRVLSVGSYEAAMLKEKVFETSVLVLLMII